MADVKVGDLLYFAYLTDTYLAPMRVEIETARVLEIGTKRTKLDARMIALGFRATLTTADADTSAEAAVRRLVAQQEAELDGVEEELDVAKQRLAIARAASDAVVTKAVDT